MEMWWPRRLARVAVRKTLYQSAIRRQLRSATGVRWLALGERNNYLFPVLWQTIDWKDADILCDFNRDPTLPIPDRSVDLIYSSHLLEHLSNPSIDALLTDCCRVLAPGGGIRIETPDADYLLDSYLRGDKRMLLYFRKYRQMLVDRLNLPSRYLLADHLSVLGEIANYIDATTGHLQVPVWVERACFDAKLEALPREEFFDWCVSLLTDEQRKTGGHQNALTVSKAQSALERAGFVDVQCRSFERTGLAGLRLGRGPRRFADTIREKPHRAFYSLYVEASAPSAVDHPGH